MLYRYYSNSGSGGTSLFFSRCCCIVVSSRSLSLSFSRFHFYCQEYFTLYTLRIYNTHNTTTTGIAIIISYYCSRSSGKRSIWECEWMWSRIMSSHKRTLSFSPSLSLRVSEAPYPHIIHIYRKEKKKGEKRGRLYYCNSTLYIITDGGKRERNIAWLYMFKTHRKTQQKHT